MIGMYKLNMQACSICEMVEKQDKQRENIVYRRIMMNKKMIALFNLCGHVRVSHDRMRFFKCRSIR